MPKADLVLPNGTKVTIEGTTDEVANLTLRLTGSDRAVGQPSRTRAVKNGGRGRTTPSALTAIAKSKPRGPADYIRELIADDYFKSKRGLSDVQKKLEEGAHIYPITHLSPVLFRLVIVKELRRIKEGGTWKYVNP